MMLWVRRRWLAKALRTFEMFAEVLNINQDEPAALSDAWAFMRSRRGVRAMARLRWFFETDVERRLGVDRSESLNGYLTRNVIYWSDSPGQDDPSEFQDLPSEVCVARGWGRIPVLIEDLERIISIMNELLISFDRLWWRRQEGVVGDDVLLEYLIDQGALERLRGGVKLLKGYNSSSRKS